MQKIKCLKCGKIVKPKRINERVYCECGACSIKQKLDYFSIGGEYEDFLLYNETTRSFETFDNFLKLKGE